jgi:hypothetical protein
MFHYLSSEEGELILNFVTGGDRIRMVDALSLTRLFPSLPCTLLQKVYGFELNLNLPLE